MRKRKKLEWNDASHIKKKIKDLIYHCGLEHILPYRIFCYETTGAKTRAVARIWGLNRIWQTTLNIEPAYILEVISEKFNRLPSREQDKVLIHELLHIPKNFSGALLAHKRKGGVNEDRVWQLYKRYERIHLPRR